LGRSTAWQLGHS